MAITPPVSVGTLDGKQVNIADVPPDRLPDVVVQSDAGPIRPWRMCGDLSDAEFLDDVVKL
jgi:hypothetical protein